MIGDSYSPDEFIRDIQSRFKPGRPETFWACEEHLRRCLIESSTPKWLNSELQKLVTDEFHVGDWLPNHVVLCAEPDWSLSVALLDGPKRYVHALPFYALYAPLDGMVLEADRYPLPAQYKNEVFDPSIRLLPPEKVEAKPLETIALQSDQYAYDFLVAQPRIVLRFATRPLRPLEWLFSKTSLQAWQANDADLGFTQLRVAANVLGRIAHQSSISPLRQMSAHPHHAVRWAAIQNLGRLNRSEALLRIREAVSDPHPHVRRAAQKTIEALERRSAR